MGFNLKSFIKNPVKKITKLVKNPASTILNPQIQDSSLYQNIVKPVVKTGTAAGLGFLVGGPVGAAISAGTTAATGGLTNKGFQPLSNIVQPIAAASVGNAVRGAMLGASGSGTLATGAPGSVLGVTNPLANLGVSTGLDAGLGYAKGGISGALSSVYDGSGLSSILGGGGLTDTALGALKVLGPLLSSGGGNQAPVSYPAPVSSIPMTGGLIPGGALLGALQQQSPAGGMNNHVNNPQTADALGAFGNLAQGVRV